MQTIIRRRGLRERTGLGYSTIFELMQSGEFPRPIKLGPRAVGWLESEVEAWQRRQIEKRDAEAREAA